LQDDNSSKVVVQSAFRSEQPSWAAQLAAQRNSAAQQAALPSPSSAASTEEKEKENAARLDPPSRPAARKERAICIVAREASCTANPLARAE